MSSSGTSDFTLAPGASIQLYCYGLDSSGGLAPISSESFAASPAESVELTPNAQGVLVTNKSRAAGTVTISATAAAADGTILSAADQGTLTAPLAVRLVLSVTQPPA